MSSYMNKIANTLTNKTSGLIGRDNMINFTNVLNRSVLGRTAKYRDIIKAADNSSTPVQLVSRKSHLALQIAGDPHTDDCVLNGVGQLGADFASAHFHIVRTNSSSNSSSTSSSTHLRFRHSSSDNYLGFDEQMPCILSLGEGDETATATKPKKRNKMQKRAIEARTELRLHQILGSDEHFALESVFYPGRFLAVLADGSVSMCKDKSNDVTHFFLYEVIGNNNNNNNIDAADNNYNLFVPTSSQQRSLINNSEATLQPIAGDYSKADEFMANQQQQQQEQPQAQPQAQSSSASGATWSEAVASADTTNPNRMSDAPPTYSNLYPTLPKFN